MNTIKFSCVVAPSDTAVPLGCEIWIDDACVFDQGHVTDPVVVAHEFSDDDGEHSLRITLKNKLPEHTQIDDQDNIVSDALLSVTEITFDEMHDVQTGKGKVNFMFVQWQEKGERAVIYPKELRTGKFILPPWMKK